MSKIIITTESELSDLIQASIRSALNDKLPKKGQSYDSSDYLSIDETSEYRKPLIAPVY
jgi:hypothetical protein